MLEALLSLPCLGMMLVAKKRPAVPWHPPVSNWFYTSLGESYKAMLKSGSGDT